MFPTLIDEQKPAPIDLGPSPRILISRLSAIGDCILTWPMLSLIKDTWPTAKITWLVDCAAEQLLKRHPLVDEVLRIPKNILLKPSQLLRTRKILKSKKFDLAIDPQGLAKSGILTWLSGAKHRLGFDRCQAREGSWLFYTMRRHPLSQHILEKQIELLEMCNIDPPRSSYGSYLDIDNGWDDSLIDCQFVQQKIKQFGLREHEFILMNPGAGWESKRWPLERFAVLADQLHENTGMKSLITWGNPREHDLARTVMALAPKSCILALDMDLVELAQWSYRAALFIGSDTGPMHLAAAVGTPCVALFGTSLPQRSGPYGPKHIAVQKRYDAGTSRYRRKTTNSAMKAIEVEDVLQACLSILQISGKGRSILKFPSANRIAA